jgi:hypothetical protein
MMASFSSCRVFSNGLQCVLACLKHSQLIIPNMPCCVLHVLQALRCALPLLAGSWLTVQRPSPSARTVGTRQTGTATR